MHLLVLLSALSGFTHLHFGISLLRLNPKALSNRLFFLLCLSFGWWALAYSMVYPAASQAQAWFWFRISAPAWCFAPALCLHLILSLSRRPHLQRIGKWIALLYLPGIIVFWRSLSGILTVTHFVPTPMGMAEIHDPTTLWYLFHVSYSLLSYFSFIVAATWRFFTTQRSAERRQHLLIVIYSLITLLLAASVNFLLPALKLGLIPGIASILTLIWTFGISRALRVNRMLELNPTVAADEIIARLNVLLFLVRPNGTIQQANPFALTLLAYPESYYERLHFADFFADRSQIEQTILAFQNHPHHSCRLTVTAFTADHKSVPMDMVGTGIYNESEQLMGIVFLLYDIRDRLALDSALKKLERQNITLQQQKQELETAYLRMQELDRLKSDFVSSVSHELRTPLTSVLGFAKMIQRDLGKFRLALPGLSSLPAGSKLITRIEANARIISIEGERLTRLINEVLDLAKIESGHGAWQENTLDLNEVLDSTISTCRGYFHELPNVQFITEIEPHLGQLVADRDRLVQVFSNLIANGVKFTPQGHVKLAAYRVESTLYIHVEDTGIGISPDQLPYVFDRFHQSHDLVKGKPTGTGLGLAICREIILHYNGDIDVQSIIGSGTTFTITLPLEKT